MESRYGDVIRVGACKQGQVTLQEDKRWGHRDPQRMCVPCEGPDTCTCVHTHTGTHTHGSHIAHEHRASKTQGSHDTGKEH